MSRVLVTGGAGFIGHRLVLALLERGDDVLVIDDLTGPSSYLPPDGVDLVARSILDVDLSEFMGGVDAVIHLAAHTSVRESAEDPEADAEVNVLGSVRVFEAAARAGVGVVFASTGGAVYGRWEGANLTERDEAVPICPYGAAKLSAEVYGRVICRLHDVPFSVLRLANVYGPGQSPAGESGVCALFGHALLSGAKVHVFGDGHQTRDFVYVDDVARAFLAALPWSRIRAGVYNVGTGIRTSVLEVLGVMSDALEVAPAVMLHPARTEEVEHVGLDCAAAAEALGWRPTTSLEEGVRATAAWLREEQGRSEEPELLSRGNVPLG